MKTHEARKASIFLFSNSITNHIFGRIDRHKITFSKCVLFEKSHFHEIVISLDVVRERFWKSEKYSEKHFCKNVSIARFALSRYHGAEQFAYTESSFVKSVFYTKSRFNSDIPYSNQPIKLRHRTGLDGIHDVDVGRHGLVVGVAGPFHYNVRCGMWEERRP